MLYTSSDPVQKNEEGWWVLFMNGCSSHFESIRRPWYNKVFFLDILAPVNLWTLYN